jgi:hypothetical protein
MKYRYLTMVHNEHKKRVMLSSLRVGGGMGGN